MIRHWRAQSSQRLVCTMAILLTAVISPVNAQSVRGSMSGTVTDTNGKPLPDVVVTYLLNPPLAASTEPPGGGVATAADGRFQFQNLRPGTYILCAFAAPYLSVLGSCEWTRSPQTVTVPQGQDVTNVQIPLAKGERLQFRVNDTKQVLGNEALGRKGPSLLAGVWEPSGFFHGLSMRSFDINGRDLELTVPAGMLMHVSLSAENAQIDDSVGAIVQNEGSGLLIQVPAGTGPKLWTFTVQPAP